jgi:hypothetical protein
MLLYGLSLPERVVRQILGFVGGLLLPLVMLLPAPLRRGKFFRLVVLRQVQILTDTVGQAGIFHGEPKVEGEAAVRMGVGGALDNALILGLHVSPVWVLLAATDLCDGARAYVATLRGELAAMNLLPPGGLGGVDDVLVGLARLSDRASDTLDMPPLSLKAMQASVQHLREDLISVAESSARLADVEALAGDLLRAAGEERGSLLQITSAVAVGSLKTVGQVAGLLTAGTCATALFVGHQLGDTVRGYSESLKSLRDQGLGRAFHGFLRPLRRSEMRLLDPRFLTYTETLLSLGRLRGAPWRRPAR